MFLHARLCSVACASVCVAVSRPDGISNTRMNDGDGDGNGNDIDNDGPAPPYLPSCTGTNTVAMGSAATLKPG